MLPGRRVLLAGAGPFLFPVAQQLRALGAEVVVAEATRRRDWLRAAPRMTAHPDKLAAFVKERVPVRWGRMIVRAEGGDRVERATIAEVDGDWRPHAEETLEVDTVCTAYGFLPSLELPRALGCEIRGGAVAHDAAMATSVAGVYVAGEAAGIGGAAKAWAEGSAAGASAAGRPRRAPRRAAGFARVLDEPVRAPPRPARADHARHRGVPLRGGHRRRHRRGRLVLRAQAPHPRRPGPVPGPDLRAADRPRALGAPAARPVPAGVL